MVALVFGLLLYAGMNAGLVAKLAILDVQLPFQALYDVSQQKSFSLCLRTNSFVYNNFTVGFLYLSKFDSSFKKF